MLSVWLFFGRAQTSFSFWLPRAANPLILQPLNFLNKTSLHSPQIRTKSPFPYAPCGKFLHDNIDNDDVLRTEKRRAVALSRKSTLLTNKLFGRYKGINYTEVVNLVSREI